MIPNTLRLSRLLFLLPFMSTIVAGLRAEDTFEQVDVALEWSRKLGGLVWRESVEPVWTEDGESFSYSVITGPGGQREHVLVNAVTGEVRRAAEAADLGLAPAAEVALSSLPAGEGPRRTRRNGHPMRLSLSNPGAEPVKLFWIDFDGEAQAYGEIAPGAILERGTYVGHVWQLETAAGGRLARFEADPARARLRIDGPAAAPAPRRRPRNEPRPVSPDGRWEVVVADNNVRLRPVAAGEVGELTLTTDGTAEQPYVGPGEWSPDSRAFLLTRVKRAPVRRITLVESSPRDQLQPKSREIDYIKPGDALADPTPVLFRLPEGGEPSVAGEVEARVVDRTLCPVFFTYDGSIDYRWSEDGREAYFDYNQRGHQVYRILAIDATSGAVRVVVEEKAEAFVDYTNKTWRHWLPGGRELLWLSERDGFAHLWNIDVAGGRAPRQLTSGAWVVRRVERVDDDGRIWFWASGLRQGENPYHQHLCRVDADGGGFLRVTEGDGTHRVAWSPDRQWLVDTWSRVDQPPVTELRRAEDGALVATLETADDSALRAAGWSRPERFVAPGRDGKTPIHGVIFRPAGFDPTRRYPVLEEIYAGPHDAFAPVAFGVYSRHQAFARMGFVVVQADGMGTNHRGRAFHAVAWKNLQDAGFPDRIAWMRAAAAGRPWMDLGRVGIYGGSAGGQSAMRALIDHADFYSVAVADCGCHDNRMDKIWWNEQWLGWPVDESYVAASNTEHAHRLRGRLLLIVGELDSNVDPASTLQVVDRLARAGKNFDFLLLPGEGHGAAETPYGTRRRAEFLLRHLEPLAASGEGEARRAGIMQLDG